MITTEKIKTNNTPPAPLDRGDNAADIFARLESYRAQRNLPMSRIALHLGIPGGQKELFNMQGGRTPDKAIRTIAAIESYMSRPPEVERLQERLDRNGQPRSEAAKALLMSEGQLSQILRGIYPSYSQKHKQLIDNFLWTQTARSEGLGEGKFLQTRNVRILFGACEFAQVNRSCAIVVGEPGCGKTIIGRRYKHEHLGTVFVDTYEAMPPTAALRALCRAVANLDGKVANKDAYFWRAVEKLRGSDRLIIIDEANQLRPEALQIIRNVSDHSGVGLVLMGTELLWRKLYEFDPSRTGEFAQLFSRAVRYNLAAATRKDSDMLVGDFLGDAGGAAAEASLKAFYEFGNRNHRSIVKLVGIAHELAKEHGGRVTPSIVEEASQMLVLGAEEILSRRGGAVRPLRAARPGLA